MGTQVNTMPVPVISCVWVSRYGFSQVWAQVAQKNPRAAHADPYKEDM